MKKLSTLFALLTIGIASFAQSNLASDANEFAALKALWESTDGAHWTNNTNWPAAGAWPSSASAATMDDWYGVVVTNGDITQLNLNGNNLSGPLPTNLNNLSQLTRLSVYDNKLTGDIPTSIGSLSKLTLLFLYNNQLTGPIPTQLASLTELTAFYLNNNQLTGSIPSELSALTKVMYFDVHSNKMSGAVPAIFSGLTNMILLSLNNNRFTGALPTLRGSSVDVSNNMLTGAFPTTTGYSVSMPITTIVASNNGFTSMPSAVTGWTSLLKLDFANNELTALPSGLSSHANKANLQLLIGNNRLDFSTLESYATGFKSTSSFTPQKVVVDQPTVSIATASPLVLTARTRGAHTQIFWDKQNANGSWSPVSNDQDTVKITYTRTSAAQSDEGVYRWRTTSSVSQFANITIQSDPIVVKSAMRFTLDNWAFQYKYDDRRRMTHKKVPGADWVYMVYDNRDRLVMTQDGEQRKKDQWTFTRYDTLNRPVMTGLYTRTTTLSQSGMRDLISASKFAEAFDGTNTSHQYTNHVMSALSGTFEPLTVTYYDNYDFVHSDPYFAYKWTGTPGQYEYTSGGHNAFPRVAGQVTGVWTRVLGSDKQWLRTVNYYDDKSRVIQSITDNHKRGQDITTNVYDFTGKVKTSKTESIDHHLTWGTLHTNSWPLEDRVSTTAGSSTFPYAFSTQQVALNSDGWVEFTCSADMSFSSNRTFGFSTSTSASNVGWGVKQAITTSTNTIQATENGTLKGSAIAAYGGDVIRIERTGTTMNYSRNGVVFYSTTGLSSRPAVYAHLILNLANSALFNPKISIAAATKSVERDFVYDHAGRMLQVWHSIDGADSLLLTKNEYNELGQLIDKKIHSSDTTNFRQSLDYRYNIRGWLTSINGANLGSNSDKNEDTSHDKRDLFGMDLLYNDDAITGLGNSPIFNGNIAAMRWSTNLGLASMKERAYKFTYDPMNRLTTAEQRTYNTAWTSSSAFHESGVTYDLNGNIKTLLRTDETGTLMDSLKYNYGPPQTASNMLIKVGDSGTASGFTDATSVDNDYAYDSNGNLTSDKNKSITSITYNHLNLPEKVTKSTNEYLIYTYDATGRKLAQDLYTSANVLKKRSDYRGEWFYENDTLRFVNHEEGRALPDGDWVSAGQMLSNGDMATTTGYTAYNGTNVTLSPVTRSGETYMKVVSNQSTSNPGFIASSYITVVPGRVYTIKAKGYRVLRVSETTAPPVKLYVTGIGLTSADIVWPGPLLPDSVSGEGWVKTNFTVPSGINRIKVGLLWQSGVHNGSTFFLNKLELYEYNGIHGNTSFSQTGYEYQYHLKDHLGNVRMTFTTKDEVETSKATVETENATAEGGEFLNYNNVRRINHPIYDHTYNTTTPPNGTTYAIRLNGSANEKIGLAKSLKVEVGDTLNIEVFAKYYEPPTGGTLKAFATLMASIIAGTQPGGTFVDGSGYSTNSATTVPGTALAGKDSEGGTPPKAYLNWLVFDRDYNLIMSKSGYKRITTAAKEDTTNIAHERLAPNDPIVIGEAGYAYIYISNENETPVEVYFDDFKVEHVKSPVIQSEDFYPFGLTFNLYQRESSVNNQYQYNGKEQQDELNLGWLDYGARMYMPDLGRWGCIDRESERTYNWTPYRYAYDNPSRFFDVDGTTEEERQKAIEAARQYIADNPNLVYDQNGVNDCAGFINIVLTSVGFPGLKTGEGEFRGGENGVSQLARNTRQVDILEAREGDLLTMWSKRRDQKGVDGEFDHVGMITKVIMDEKGNVKGFRIANFQGSGLKEFNYLFTDGNVRKGKGIDWVSLRGAYQWDTADGNDRKKENSRKKNSGLTLEVLSDPERYKEWIKNQLEASDAKQDYETRNAGSTGGTRR